MDSLIPSRFGRRAAAVVGLLAVAMCVGLSWRSLYVRWQIRAARASMDLRDTHDVQKAIGFLEAARDVDRSESPELLFLLGRAYRRTGALEQAFACLKKAEAAGWSEDECRQQIQLGLVQRGGSDHARGSLDLLMRQNPSDEIAYDVYEAMAKGYLHVYRFNDALHCLNFWISWCPNATDPLIWRAGIHEQTHRWDEANDDYRSVLKINSQHLEARLSLARNLLLQQNQATEAHAEFQRCLTQAPDDPGALLGMATCERQLAEPQRAEARIRNLLTRDLTPELQSAAQAELGLILLDQQETQEAIDLLKDVVRSDPQNAAARYALGTAYAALQDTDSATECFKESRRITEKMGRLSTITSELINHPENAELRWEAGRILMDQGLFSDGAAWMSTALLYDPAHQKTHHDLAEYYTHVKPDARLAEQHRSQFGLAAKPGS